MTLTEKKSHPSVPLFCALPDENKNKLKLSHNMLKQNDDKTEILIIRPKSANQHLLPESVRIANTNVTPNTHARNLGVTFDCNMSLERHITSISRTAYYHLHSIVRIRRYLEQRYTKQLVHALVISRIDCCNSFLN